MQVECGTLCLSWGWAGSGLVCICDTTVFACVIYHIYLYATAHFLGFLCSCSGNDEEQTKKSFFLPSCLLQVAKSGLQKVQGVEPPTCYPGQSDSVVPGPGVWPGLEGTPPVGPLHCRGMGVFICFG